MFPITKPAVERGFCTNQGWRRIEREIYRQPWEGLASREGTPGSVEKSVSTTRGSAEREAPAGSEVRGAIFRTVPAARGGEEESIDLAESLVNLLPLFHDQEEVSAEAILLIGGRLARHGGVQLIVPHVPTGVVEPIDLRQLEAGRREGVLQRLQLSRLGVVDGLGVALPYEEHRHEDGGEEEEDELLHGELQSDAGAGPEHRGGDASG